MTSVLVAGGGIGGCAVALAAARAGAYVTVCEAHPTVVRDDGAWLTVAPGGVRALGALGVLDAVDRVAGRLEAFHVQDVEGADTAVSPLGDGVAYRYLTWRALTETLAERVHARGIEIRRGTRVVDAEPAGDGVGVTLDDGSRVHADLLVGADGVRSRVRALVDPAGPAPRHVGQTVFFGFSPERGHGTPGDFHVVHCGVPFGYVPTGEATWWFARLDIAPLGGVAGAAARRAALDEHIAPLGGVPSALVDPSPGVFAIDAYDLALAGPWSRAGMVLVGDAAHATSPSGGQGSAMALEDAVVLGKALRDRPDPASAAAAFEAARRDRTQAVIMASARESARGGPLPDAPAGREPSAEELADQLDWDVALPG